MGGNDVRTRFDLDVGRARNLINEVPGHVFCKRVGTYQHGYMTSVFCKVNGGLTSRVRASYDIHVFIYTSHGLSNGAAIVDSLPRQVSNSWYIQSAVRDPAGEHEDMAT